MVERRKLAAILAADIAGYSAIMGADEEATVRDLKGHQAVVLPLISEHGGRVIDTAGDGILAEFQSAVNAVKAALAVQRTMAERNAADDPARRLQFRIGINQGDIVFDDTRVYGDGVNIAARLEAIAHPGGICISSKVLDEINGRIEFTFEDLGPQQLKNIAQSVRVYRIDVTPVAVAVAVTRPALALPDKPSIAVLPFANLSGDAEQEYLADGIVEDIITELSRFSELFVIARNSSFQYKGKATDVRQVGREFGVRHVLVGSLRRRGDRLRVAVQLIDAATGAHRWAERYDCKLEDIFAVQDEVVRTIVVTLAAHVQRAETERARAKPPNSWQAYDYCLQALDAAAAFTSKYRVEELHEARRLLQQSLSIDPNYARSYALLAITYSVAWTNPLHGDFLNPRILDQALDWAHKAVQLDRNLPQAHAALGHVLTWKHQHDDAVAAFERATALNPNYVDWQFGLTLIYAGASKRAIDVVQACMRLDPFYMQLASFVLAFAHYMLGQYPQALLLLRDYIAQAPSFRAGHGLLAATYARLGHIEEARAHAAELLCLGPTFTISGAGRALSAFKDPEDDKHFFDGLRKAGLPE
jgi:adenylate cyclase